MPQFVGHHDAKDGRFASTPDVVQFQDSMIGNVAEGSPSVVTEKSHPVGVGGKVLKLMLDVQNDRLFVCNARVPVPFECGSSSNG